MFYKYDRINNLWYTGKIIYLPKNITLNEDNKQEIDGWYWSDEEPKEYTTWLEQNNY